MKDCKGNVLLQGDRVVYSPRKSSQLYEATIERFTPSGQAIFERGTNTGYEYRKHISYLLKIS